MDDRDVDALARSLAGSETRRTLLQLLAGGALGGLAARLGLAEDAEAKKQRQRRVKQTPLGTLQAEGKRKKHKGKKQDNDKPRPCGAACTNKGGRCCPGGSCAAQGACCPGEKRCGGGCITQTDCCPYTEILCPDGSCVNQALCCPGDRLCADGLCVHGTCCPDERQCADGSCVTEDECCDDDLAPLCVECQEEVCDNGEWTCEPVENGSPCELNGGGQGICCGGGCDARDVTCSGLPWREFNPATCNCECSGGGTETSGHYFSCPAGFPHERAGGMCCPSGQSSLVDCVCLVGFHTCPWSDYECCLDGTNAHEAESASTGIGDAAASGAEDHRRAGTTPGRRSNGHDRIGRKSRRGADGSGPRS